jgi:signal transduction histidine kinase
VNYGPEPELELVRRTRWYIRLRWYLLLIITIPTLASLYISPALASQRRDGVILVAVVLGSNVVFSLLSRLRTGRRYSNTIATLIIAFDVLFISFFIYSKGGIESRSQLLYALPILTSALLFSRLGVYATAAGAALSYDFVIIANYFGWIHSPDMVTSQATDWPYVLNTVIFFTAAIMLVGILTDFLTRLLIQKETEARHANSALRRAQAIAHVGSWEWNIESDTISWSDELYRIFGLPIRQPMNFESFLSGIHPEDRQRVAAIITRSLKTHKPYSFEHRVLWPNKMVRVVHGEGKIVTDRGGRVVQMYGTSQDVTAERALEVAKGDFVALASHQLRTPASGVRMLLAMLRDGYVDPLTPSQLQMVEEAYGANERLLRISDDLLNVAKLEAGRLVLNKQRMELHLWLKNVVEPHKLLARQRRQRLKLEVPKGVWYLQGDQERLAMVIDNLLSNARKYTPARGLIRVALLPGKRVHKITVTDSGSGMTHNEIANLFGKFTRLDNPASRGSEGTGLGLYLAKSIVDLHQGSIKVLSKPGAGSAFTITLPCR